MESNVIAGEMEQVRPVGEEQLLNWTRTLQSYSAGRKKTADRIISSENWWKLRNSLEEKKATALGQDGSFVSQSGWLHNVVASKHADAMDAFPEAAFLPREESDEEEAQKLDAIVPCILEQNDFEETYSAIMWQKTKTGTGVYKIIWDNSKLYGLGDINIIQVNLLNLYWQPEIKDIQKSRYFFQTELVEREVLEEEYPELAGKLKGQAFTQAKFLNDETCDDKNVVVIEVYYHKNVNGRRTLQYCKYVGDHVLFASENETEPITDEMGNVTHEAMAVTGLYDHGLYPYVFDPLFPVEGSPCGYGYIDLCRNPQIAIDVLKSAIIKNSMVGSSPRYFSRVDGNVQEKEFLDLTKPIVHVSGNVDEASLRPIDYNPLSGVYVNVLQDTVSELRETSGNTETAAGTGTPSGVTAAAAIAALQEASGKGSRDASRSSYRAFRKVVTMVVELIRQFYDLPRQFRIIGQSGQTAYVEYTNANIKPQAVEAPVPGFDIGERVPVFDVSIQAQKRSAYSAMAQNELALQFYQLGFFQPQQAQQALTTLDIMDFDGKDKVIRKIQENDQTMDMLTHYMQFALDHAETPEMARAVVMDMQQVLGVQAPAAGVSAEPADQAAMEEHPSAAKAREQSAQASMPR